MRRCLASPIRLFRSAICRNTISEQIAPAPGQHVRALDACRRRDAEEAARHIAKDIETSCGITLGLWAA